MEPYYGNVTNVNNQLQTYRMAAKSSVNVI